MMICITCVDALLGTDMERICRKAEEKTGLPVRPCYMYALTREGRKPPMVHVRQSLYSLLEPKKKKGNVVNLLGFFSPLMDDCELYRMLERAGVKTIHEISRCKDYEEYQTMAEANFNLVFIRKRDLQQKIFMRNCRFRLSNYGDYTRSIRLRSSIRHLGSALGLNLKMKNREKAELDAVENLKVEAGCIFAIGECMNGDPFELALALVKYGFQVAEIYGTLTAENFVYLKHLSELSPQTKVFSNMEPTMIYYDHKESGVTTTIGKDACYYHPDAENVMWNEEVQPYGYAGVKHLCERLLEV